VKKRQRCRGFRRREDLVKGCIHYQREGLYNCKKEGGCAEHRAILPKRRSRGKRSGRGVVWVAGGYREEGTREGRKRGAPVEN